MGPFEIGLSVWRRRERRLRQSNLSTAVRANLVVRNTKFAAIV